MSIDTTNVSAIVFDYGNTLIPFNQAQIDAYSRTLADAVEDLYGPLDRKAFNDYRAKQRMAPYQGDPPPYKENDLREITIWLIEALYDKTPTDAELETLLRVRYQSFLDVIETADGTTDVLAALKPHYRLGLLSNYPDGPAIRESLRKIRLFDFFESIVVSGDLGLCKPHPAVFDASLNELGLRPEEVIFVGDNWLADVQGAKGVGMQAIHMRRWIPPEYFKPGPNDHQPDAAIEHLNDLKGLLVP